MVAIARDEQISELKKELYEASLFLISKKLIICFLEILQLKNICLIVKH